MRKVQALKGFTPLEISIIQRTSAKFLTGFTIVEFVLVITIIALISATVGVSLSAFTPRKLENEVGKLVADLNWVRAMAVSTRFHYRIDFDLDNDNDIDSADNQTYIISRIDIGNSLNITPLSRKILKVDTINVTQGANGTAQVEFDFMNPQGVLNITVEDPVIIRLRRSNAEVDITIRNLTGHISWVRP